MTDLKIEDDPDGENGEGIITLSIEEEDMRLISQAASILKIPPEDFIIRSVVEYIKRTNQESTEDI